MDYFREGVIPETDSHEEMRNIGKEIVLMKPNLYTEKCINKLMKDIYSFTDSKIEKSKAMDVFYETVYNYWVFGSNISEWFRYGFYSKNSSEKQKYYTSKNKILYLSYLNDKGQRYKLDDKYETYKLLKPYYNRRIMKISSEEDYEDFVNFIEKDQVIVKPENGGLGAGIHKISLKNSLNSYEVFLSVLREGAIYREENEWVHNSSVIIEEIIEQDKTMASLHPKSLNVVRLTTIRVNDKVVFFYPWLKVGMNGAEATGSYQGNSFDAGIDVNTGVVDTFGMTRNLVIKQHPNTGIRIKGFKIPKWDELISLASKLPPHFTTI